MDVVGFVAIWVVPLAAMLLVSACYFRASPSSSSFGLRALVSAHGVVGAMLLSGAPALAAIGWANPNWRTPYLLIWLVPIALVAISLWQFVGPKWVHSLQVVNLAAMAWATMVGVTVAGGGK